MNELPTMYVVCADELDAVVQVSSLKEERTLRIISSPGQLFSMLIRTGFTWDDVGSVPEHQ